MRITGAQIRNPLTPVSALPSSCQPYSVYFLTTTNTPYICTAANTFTPLSTVAQSGSGLPSSTGTAGYLMTNGTAVSWTNLLTGGSGGLDCSSVPGQCDLVPAVVPFKASANTWTGLNDFSGALFRLPETTVAGLPGPSSNTGREFIVTDGASTCDTTVGGGSTSVLVRSNGTAYVAPNCGGTSDGSGSDGSGSGSSGSGSGGSGNSGSGSGPAIYNQSGPLSNAHITTFVASATSYGNEWSYTLSGGAQFVNQPNCTVSTVENAIDGDAAYYCTAVQGGSQSSTCAHASTGSVIWLHGTLSPGNDYVVVTCIGN